MKRKPTNAKRIKSPAILNVLNRKWSSIFNASHEAMKSTQAAVNYAAWQDRTITAGCLHDAIRHAKSALKKLQCLTPK